MSSEEQETAHAQVVRIATGMLNRTVGITEGARRLAALGSKLGTDRDSDFIVFVGIDSEADWFPLGAARSQWSPEALARYDAERLEAEEFYRHDAEQACRRLITRYGQQA